MTQGQLSIALFCIGILGMSGCMVAMFAGVEFDTTRPWAGMRRLRKQDGSVRQYWSVGQPGFRPASDAAHSA